MKDALNAHQELRVLNAHQGMLKAITLIVLMIAMLMMVGTLLILLELNV